MSTLIQSLERALAPGSTDAQCVAAMRAVQARCQSVIDLAKAIAAELSPGAATKPKREPRDPTAPSTVPFGMHKGKSYSDPSLPTKYLEWLSSLPDLRAHTREEVDCELMRRNKATAGSVDEIDLDGPPDFAAQVEADLGTEAPF